MKVIIIIGPIPPPIGGVSVHISRLHEKIKLTYNTITVDSTRVRISFILRFLIIIFKIIFSHKKYIIHNHVSRIRFNYFVSKICKVLKIKYVQSYHSFRIDTRDLNKINKYFLQKTLFNSDEVIVVNENIKKDILDFYHSNSLSIQVIPAFIPYVEKSIYKDNDKYIQNLKLDKFTVDHKYIISANAYKISFYNNQDLYGIDLCIELMRKIKNKYNDEVGFIFMLPQVTEKRYFDELNNKILNYEVNNNFIFVNETVELVPLFKYIDIFIRPTNTDGDSISVREALYEGVPTIASDIVSRPDGVITFKNRNIDDLLRKTIFVLDNLKEEKCKAMKYGKQQQDYFNRITQIYEKLFFEGTRN